MVKFGTGGWRGIIGQDFVDENIRKVAQALADLMADEKMDGLPVMLGFDRRFLSYDAARWFAEVEMVVEGAARGVTATTVTVRDAPGVGDDALVERVERRAAEGQHVTLVTSDRGLAARVDGVARVRGARWLLDRLEAAGE